MLKKKKVEKGVVKKTDKRTSRYKEVKEAIEGAIRKTSVPKQKVDLRVLCYLKGADSPVCQVLGGRIKKDEDHMVTDIFFELEKEGMLKHIGQNSFLRLV